MGDLADTTSVQTDTGADTGADTSAADASTETVLTGTAASDTETNLDAAGNSVVDDATGVDDKSADGDAGKEGSDTPPDTYADFVMPEGIQVDTALLEQAAPIFKELGLTQDQAQKLVDFQAEQVQAGSQKQIDDFNQLMNDWRTQASNDKEYGGDKFDENIKIGQNAITTYGTPELKQLLEEQGVGNHPEVIRFMVRVGQTLKEDVPGSSGTAPAQAQDRVTSLYGDQSKN